MTANVDIDLAVRTTLSALTLSEKKLARDLLYSKQFGDFGMAWLRAPSFNLKKAIETGRAGPTAVPTAAADPPTDGARVNDARTDRSKEFLLEGLSIYCDTLIIDPDTFIDSNQKTLEIDIYARRIIGSSLTFKTIPGCYIGFGMPHLPPDFEVTINGKVEKPVVYTAKGFFGVRLTHPEDASEPVHKQFHAPNGFMDTINWLDLINEDGSVSSKGNRSDDLPRLLQMQLLVAQAHTRTNSELSLALLNYVIAATADPSSLQLNYQASSLRNELVLQSGVMAVPSVNIYASKQVLKARLAAAMAFEVSFQAFSAQLHVEGNRTWDALDMLAKSDDAISAYKFTLGIRHREYDSAVTANDKAVATYKQNNKDIERLKKDFEEGIEAYQRGNTMEAVWSVIAGVFSIAVTVAATVVTVGAAAPAVGGAVALTAKLAADAGALVKKVIAIAEAIDKIIKEIQPILEKLGKLVKSAKLMVETLRQLEDKVGNAETVKLDMQHSDIFNAMAEWDRFDVTVNGMVESLREHDIKGKDEFFHALKTLVINGRCYLQTQANLVKKGDELATVMLQSKHKDNQHERLSKMAYKSTTDASVVELLRRAMFDRLLAIRALVYLDFATYLSAYNYHTMLKDNPISLSPVKPVVDYLEDAARLQAAVVSYGARALAQSQTFVLHSLGDGLTTGDELVAQLERNGTVKVTVDPTDDMWTGFTRIRMSAVRCYLAGVTSKSNIRLRMHTDGSFFDREFTVVDDSKDKKILTRSFLGDARTLLFEYRVQNGESEYGDPVYGKPMCDGQYLRDHEYTKHTPLASWEISLMGWNQRKERGLDLTGVKSVVLEFECEVLYVDE